MGGKSGILALVALGVALCAGPAAAACKLGLLAELPVTMDGLDPVVPAKINGVDARLVADSGAFFSMVTPDAAARFGLKRGPLPQEMTVRGVTGEADVGVATAKEFTFLGHSLHNIEFLVGGSAMDDGSYDGFLGQNVLNIADVEFDFANGVIRLFKPTGCGHAVLTYWDKTLSGSALDIQPTTSDESFVRTTASVDGARIVVLFDSGAERSTLTLHAAKRSGITVGSPGVVAAGQTGGIGRRMVDTWIAPFSSFRIGDEEVRNTRLRIGAIEVADADMLLGADFFLSHRIYLSRGQSKLYFTYNGGPVFHLDGAQTQPPAAEPTAAGSPGQPAGEPKDAGGYSRRGSAFAARRDFAHAIADFTRAAELEPREPGHLYNRAVTRIAAGKPVEAMADLDQALKLKPDHVEALMRRGKLRLANKDEAGARADLDSVSRLRPASRLEIAEIYAGARLFEPSVALYGQWITDNPKAQPSERADVLNARCWTRALWGKELDHALADCNEAGRLMPRSASLLDSRGMVHLRLGQFDESIADYDAALRVQPKIAWSLYGRGLAKLRKGMKAEGEADLKAAADVQPGIADEAKGFGIEP